MSDGVGMYREFCHWPKNVGFLDAVYLLPAQYQRFLNGEDNIEGIRMEFDFDVPSGVTGMKAADLTYMRDVDPDSFDGRLLDTLEVFRQKRLAGDWPKPKHRRKKPA